eukprot:2265425-Amphidinium_carterae.1
MCESGESVKATDVLVKEVTSSEVYKCEFAVPFGRTTSAHHFPMTKMVSLALNTSQRTQHV